MDIRIKIDILRKEKGWSRSELAKKIGISYTAVKNWYNSKDFMPSLRVIEDVCNVFEISKAQLFSDVNLDKLSGDQIELLNMYDKLSAKQKENVLKMINLILMSQD